MRGPRRRIENVVNLSLPARRGHVSDEGVVALQQPSKIVTIKFLLQCRGNRPVICVGQVFIVSDAKVENASQTGVGRGAWVTVRLMGRYSERISTSRADQFQVSVPGAIEARSRW